MRILKANDKDTFRVKAYAGTNGVLLAFDLAEARKPGFLGFATLPWEIRTHAGWLSSEKSRRPCPGHEQG